jgi:protein-S-isoprenylcysteine O-methyltransferase Ste14
MDLVKPDRTQAPSGLRWKAIFAFVTLPGVMTGIFPFLIIRADGTAASGSAIGYFPIVLGFMLLVACVRDFCVVGRGTLAPWNPPKHLVTVGLYRYVRNPMYVAMTILLIGWSIVLPSQWLIVYLVGLWIAFHLRVVLYEEPRLLTLFGAEWQAYQKNVPRWIPRPSAWRR